MKHIANNEKNSLLNSSSLLKPSLLAVLLFLSLSASEETTDFSNMKTNDFVSSIREKYSLPSIALSVFTVDSTLYESANGSIGIGDSDEDTVDMPYHIGSLTKAFTSYLAAKEVDKGTIKWETEFFELFPELKDDARRKYYHITLEQLLSHRAGIPELITRENFQELADRPIEDSSTARYEYAEELLQMRPTNIGELSYSNCGYTLASLMLEKASGKQWEELAEETFGTEIGLDVMIGWPEDHSATLPKQHIEVDGETVQGSLFDMAYQIRPAGDLAISITDMTKWGKVHLGLLDGSNKSLTSETANFMYYGRYEYAMGWGQSEREGNQLLSHTGSAGSFFSVIVLNVTEKRGLVILINSVSDTTHLALQELSEEILKRTLENNL